MEGSDENKHVFEAHTLDGRSVLVESSVSLSPLYRYYDEVESSPERTRKRPDPTPEEAAEFLRAVRIRMQECDEALEAAFPAASAHDAHGQAQQNFSSLTDKSLGEEEPSYDQHDVEEFSLDSMDTPATTSPCNNSSSTQQQHTSSSSAQAGTSSANIHLDTITESSHNSSSESSADESMDEGTQSPVPVDHRAMSVRAEEALLNRGFDALLFRLPDGSFICQRYDPKKCQSQNGGESL